MDTQRVSLTQSHGPVPIQRLNSMQISIHESIHAAELPACPAPSHRPSGQRRDLLRGGLQIARALAGAPGGAIPWCPVRWGALTRWVVAGCGSIYSLCAARCIQGRPGDVGDNVVAAHPGLLHGGALPYPAPCGLRHIACMAKDAAALQPHGRPAVRRRLLALLPCVAARGAAPDAKNEELGRLTGGVAHDFHCTLTVIRNNLHLLKRTAPKSALRQIESIARAMT